MQSSFQWVHNELAKPPNADQTVRKVGGAIAVSRALRLLQETSQVDALGPLDW